jgi:ATP-dependent RNA helicase RhlE
MVRTLVFTRTKHGANKVVTRLIHARIGAEAIHANKSQSQRERALASFRAGRTPVLVATDIAARGIDVDGITHVVNFDLPNVPESYVHRIGRTARAGADGAAISFCDRTERAYLRDIEREIRMRIPVLEGGPPRIEGAPERPPLEARPEGQDSSGPERRYGGPRHDGPRRDDAPSRPQGGGHGGAQRRSGGFRHRESRGPAAPAGSDARGPDQRGQEPRGQDSRGPLDDRPRTPV